MSRGIATALVVVASAWLSLGMAVPGASAHGKDVLITLDSLSAGAADSPLTRLYRADVRYATDNEPVAGARLAFSAVRQEDGSSGDSVAFSELSGSPGTYVAEIHYARFGTWEITLRTEFPGQGETVLFEKVAPSGAGVAGPTTPKSTTQARFSLQFDGRDVLNIGVRTLHSIAGMVYVAVAGVLFLAAVFKLHAQGNAVWDSIARAALPLGVGVLVIITISGVYTGYFDGPIRAPGAFDLTAMSQVPFGTAYVIALSAKVFLALAVLVFLDQARTATTSSSRSAVVRLGAAYGTLVVLLLASVAVLVYLHSLSHLAGYLPTR